MTTYKQIEDILKYTSDARIKAKEEYFIEAKRSMQKAIKIIDSL